jgi:L-fuconolactonase
MAKVTIIDAQVHGPALPPGESRVPGYSRGDLLAEMSAAQVDKVVLVPFIGHTEACIDYARKDPDRFVVMGVFALADGPDGYETFRGWLRAGHVLGLRLSFYAEETRALLEAGRLGWVWEAAQQDQIPVMLNLPQNVHQLAELAPRYPGVRFIVDHMGLTPFRKYTDFSEALTPLLSLAQYDNVAVKATALPAAVDEGFPFRSLHDPIHRVVDAFGPRRVFWGSDMSRIPCPYTECVRLFTDELPFLTGADRELVLGRGLAEWLRWPARATGT